MFFIKFFRKIILNSIEELNHSLETIQIFIVLIPETNDLVKNGSKK